MAEVFRDYVTRYPHARRVAVAATTLIEVGNAVSRQTSGFCRHLVNTDDAFMGFAIETVNNVGGDGAAYVRVIPQGITDGNISGINDSSIDRVVYMVNSTFFTLTAAGNLPVGRLFEVRDASGNMYVSFRAEGLNNWP